MKQIAITLSLAFAVFLVGSPISFADDVDPEKVDASCKSAVADIAKSAANGAKNDIIAHAGELVKTFKTMRTGCSALRTCKRDCRKAKRTAKKDCKSLKGAEKRTCKKAARSEKKSCVTTCRGQQDIAECKAGRRQFWGGVAKLLKNAATTALRGKVETLSVICVPLYEKHAE